VKVINSGNKKCGAMQIDLEALGLREKSGGSQPLEITLEAAAITCVGNLQAFRIRCCLNNT
jgi:hypothetical protein